MAAWGGHQNGRIPLEQLVPVGRGAISGAPQYLHPAAARAWRTFQGSLRSLTGANVLITEGYRTFALQQHYWNTLPFPQAATPGTSTHGWALAVDMANYQSVPRATLRALAESLGWSFATGDRVREPWHIEYAGTLELADVDPPSPITPPIPEPPLDEEGNAMQLKQTHTKNPNGAIVRALHAPGTGYWLEWTESGATFANRFAAQFQTGSSVEVTWSLFGAMRRAALALNPRSAVQVEIAKAD